MLVDLIAGTHSYDEVISRAVGGFERGSDASHGEHVIETAGRLCYLSFHRPGAKTATNKGYLEHILEVGHESVLEHASATFLIQGVSRSLTHELVRSRHLSFSQLSQRYVDESDTEFVMPPAAAVSLRAEVEFEEAFRSAKASYQEIVYQLTQDMPALKRKEIRQAARAVLPNATETKIVVTGNYRAWRHFITLRATEAADVEIRALAVEILRQLKDVAPNAFQDFLFADAADGSTIAIRDGG